MSDFPTAGDPGFSDPDTLGAIPPVVSVTYCADCGNSANRGSHIACRKHLETQPPTYCTTCRRQLTVHLEGREWTATCKKHGESSGTLAEA